MKDGYDTFEIAALTSKHQVPASVYSRVYSTLEKGFKSQNAETINGLDFIKKHFANVGIYTADRWYGNNLFLNTLLKKMMNAIL